MTPSVRRFGLWLPGLLVAAGAAVATAHGLYEVARAAGAPAPIAALYPLICDGLALVAYGATSRLYGSGRSYAWTIVVLAASLSGLAQAAYLAGGGVRDVPEWLRFGVGAWPAAAAAVVAHLLHQLGRTASYDQPYACTTDHPQPGVRPCTPPYSPYGAEQHVVRPAVDGTDDADDPAPPTPGERAHAAACAHRERVGLLPTVSELMAAADVARGTAGAVLKRLRAEHSRLQIAPVDPARTDR